jgi:osmoprotectant transport system substrate-binding protein
VLTLALAMLFAFPSQAQTIKIGSKNFAEAYIVANIYAEALEDAGYTVQRRINLGATAIAHGAIASGEIDIYPEYTGTVLAAVVKEAATSDPRDVYDRVKRYYETNLGLTLLAPTAVNNSYAIVVMPETARRYNLTNLSSLPPHAPQMELGAPGEFAVRSDGVPALRRVYGIEFKGVRAFAEMRLRYEALLSGDLAVIDAYSTDWQIAEHGLVVLDDDKHVFPPYQLVPIVRQDIIAAHPGIVAVLERIGPFLTDERMREMNAGVERDRREPADVARQFLIENGLLKGGVPGVSMSDGTETAACGDKPLCWTLANGPFIAKAALQHLYLAGASVLIGLALAILLGVPSATRPRLYAVLLTTGTAVFVVPTLALFALLIPVFGLGVGPALTALSAYCFLILFRNVVTGLRGVPAEVVDAAIGLGFDRWRRLWQVELPLALPLIVSGIRIAMVTAIGTATVASFISAGGLGEIILAGIGQAYPEKILVGGGLSAGMAISFDLVLAWLARRLSTGRRAPS